MTQEDKELLLKDLCARVPYHPKGHVVNACNGAQCDEWLTYATFPMFTNITNNCRLYLRPMSSMTEEEDKEYAEVMVKSQDCSLENSESATTMANDWLLSKGFDVRGLISKGLALVAPEGMYEY